jgi:hypothetical protein
LPRRQKKTLGSVSDHGGSLGLVDREGAGFGLGPRL